MKLAVALIAFLALVGCSKSRDGFILTTAAVMANPDK